MPKINEYTPEHRALGILNGVPKETLQNLPFGGLPALVREQINKLYGKVFNAEEAQKYLNITAPPDSVMQPESWITSKWKGKNFTHRHRLMPG